MAVKGNQPELLKWVSSVFDDTVWMREAPRQAETTDLEHGRIETRKLLVSACLRGRDLWPGIEQVFQISRSVTKKKSKQRREEVVYGVTSLSEKQASAAELLKAVRQHWTIENKSHWVRDVTYDEDRSQVRRGSIPQVMAALRNTVIGLMRSAGESNIAAACRKFAAQPWSALALIGIKPES